MLCVSASSDEINPEDATSAIWLLLCGPFGSIFQSNQLTNLGNVIFYSVPLIMTGLSVAFAFKTGLFNIGAPGQYIMGTMGCLLVALTINTTNRFGGVMVWILALIVGVLFGALWGAIPGLLKAHFKINEVIVGIMSNWIAANISTWVFTNMPSIHSTMSSKPSYLTNVVNNYTPKIGLEYLFPGAYIDLGIIIAIVVAVIVLFLLNKTTFGYEIKACGFNRDASKYAGINVKRNIVISMAIAGGLSGLGACLYYLNPGIMYNYASQYSSLPSYGFNGIASAFLASCNPVGIIFSSIFIRWISMGGEYLNKLGFNQYISDVVIAVIIYLAGFSRVFYEFIDYIVKKKKLKKELPQGEEAKT